MTTHFGVVSRLPHLELLRLKGLQRRVRFATLRRCKSLVSLNLSQSWVSDEDLITLLPALSRLNWLHLKCCPFISSNAFSTSTGAPQLQHLSVEDSRGLDDGSLAIFATYAQLEHLDLSGIGAITADGVRLFCQGGGGRRLRFLGLVGCARMTDFVVPALCEKLPSPRTPAVRRGQSHGPRSA